MLKQVGLALYNFEQNYGHLPPLVQTDEVGRSLSSWRFCLAPHLDCAFGGVHLEQRWNDPANRWICDSGIPPFCWRLYAPYPDCVETNVMAITGPGTPFDNERPFRLEGMDPDTILAVEVADTGIHWAEPGDLSFDTVPPSIVQGLDGDGVHVLFADGRVWFLRSDVPFDDLQKFFTIQGSKQYDRDTILGPYADLRR